MASLHSIFQDIADIISDESNTETLKLKIETNQLDWEKIVPVASKHLVIPLLYCKLKEKDLLDILPVDLQSYLEEITNQNRDRNKTIIKEVNEISLLFKKHEVDHVLLKGVALLISGIYNDIGERMIGDIDVLVNPDQLLKAQEILLQDDYTSAKESLTDKFIEQKHLPRLIPKTKLAAIELHRRLLHVKSNKILHEKDILKNKHTQKDIYIPDDKTLFLHGVLNFEVNDLGYYYNYLGLRNAYDGLILLEKLNTKQSSKYLTNKYVRSFFNKVSCYFSLIQLDPNDLKKTLSRSIFILKQKYRRLNTVHFFIFNLNDVISLISRRFLLFIINPSYRKASFKKRKQILSFVKSRIK